MAAACGGTVIEDRTPNDTNNNATNSNNVSGSPDAGPSSSACEDVSGTWAPTGLNTCVAPQDRCTLTQTGCQAELECSSGAFSVSGAVDGDRFELTNGANRCTGSLSGDRMSATCSGPDILQGQCSGDFTRAGGGGGGAPIQITGSGTCETGATCDLICQATHGCQQTCGEGATCDSTCSAGGCQVDCLDGADCDATCSGGGCNFTCHEGASCDFTCSGGGCNFTCDTDGRCTTSCTGRGCTGG